MNIIDKSHLLGDNPLDSSYGASIQDFDGDGELEIYVTASDGPNHLYKRINGKFRDITPDEIASAEYESIGVAAADMSGNGLPDIYVMNTSAYLGPMTDPDQLFVNKGELNFEDFMENHPDRNIASGRSICWTDPLGTGLIGLYLCNIGAPNKLFINRGEFDFRNYAAVGHGLGVITGGRGVISQDFFGSGHMDIFCLNEVAPNFLYKNLGNGQFEECAEELGLADSMMHGRGIQVCDLDRDGNIEFIWVNWQGYHRVMRLGPDGKYHDVAPKSWAKPSQARNLLIADLDNDGWEELFVNNFEEPNRLFRNVAGELIELDPGCMRLPDGAGTGATLGDLDGDGILEIYVCHGESMPQKNKLFSAEPNNNSWVRIMPLSQSGGPAIGAKVKMLAEKPVLRFIDGGSGYLGQMEPVAHFGLGIEKNVPDIHIRWTDGAEVLIENADINSLLAVEHPGQQ